MKKLKYLLLIFIVFITSNVFAQDFNVETSKITSPEGQGRTGTYSGLEIYNGGSSAVYNIGTRYNGRLSRIWFNLISGGYADPEGFEKGHTYTLAMNMATQDWRNGFGSVSVKCEGTGNNLSNSRVTFVSMYKIKFSFTTPTDRFCQFVYIDLKSSNINSTYITGTSNWNLSSMVISDPAYDSGGGSGGSGGTTDPNQSVIDNQNQNTQDIINNNNQNTQDIIDNNNSNTQELKDTINNGLQTCRDSYNLVNQNALTVGYISQDGTLHTGGGSSYTTDIIPVSSDTYTVSGGNIERRCYYSNGTFEQCISANTTTFSIPSNINGIRIQFTSSSLHGSLMFNKGSTAKTYEPYGEQICKSKIDETNDAINNLNDTINNDNVDSGVGTDFFSDFQDNSHGLTSIITAPLTAITSITSSTCQPLTIPIPFTNGSVSLPCMTQIYQDNIPTIYNIWKVVSFGIIAYFICVDIFHIVKGFKDPESDKVEVLDL